MLWIIFFSFKDYYNKFILRSYGFIFSQLTDINECSSSPCENGGTCSDAVNEYSCSCVAGYASPVKDVK